VELIDADFFETDSGTNGILIYREGIKRPIAWYSAARIETVVRVEPIENSGEGGREDKNRRATDSDVTGAISNRGAGV